MKKRVVVWDSASEMIADIKAAAQEVANHQPDACHVGNGPLDPEAGACRCECDYCENVEYFDPEAARQ